MRRQFAKSISLCLIGVASLVIILTNNTKSLYGNNEYESDYERQRDHKKIPRKIEVNMNTVVPVVELLVRPQRTAKGIETLSEHVASYPKPARTTLDDIFISVKTTIKNHKLRMKLLLDTWINNARKQTYIFTETDDPDLLNKAEPGHVINTNCSVGHDRKSLVCKMAQEFDWFINMKKRWFCHVDDDTYLNVQRLVTFLQQYNHTDDWYLGRPSLDHPIEVMDRTHPGQNLAFWFATGGAGFCLSRALALKMVPHAGGGRLMRAAEHIRLADDCTIGYIIDNILHKELTVIKLFHSHLEALWKLRQPDIKEQITFGYSLKQGRTNVVNVHGFPSEKDPTRFLSIHCHLNPLSQICLPLET